MFLIDLQEGSTLKFNIGDMYDKARGCVRSAGVQAKKNFAGINKSRYVCSREPYDLIIK